MIKNRMFEQGATLLMSTCCVILLGSCGSGAVTAPPAPDPAAGTPLAVSPPTADLFPDLPTTFTITGGRSGYTAFSSNSAVLPITSNVTGSTFSVVPNAVTAETAVEITVRDAANTSATAKATVKPSALNNQITFTPFGPTANGCGTNALCSGGDAQIVVKAVQNGVVLRNRTIRFDVFQGGFKLVTPSSGALVNSLLINTDEQGEAVARVTANVGAATQVATIQSTDVTSGLARRYNFNIVQQISGVGILSTLPSGVVTFVGAKGDPGLDGLCPSGSNATVDYYIFGGTPPYRVASPLPSVATVSPGTVATNGGRFTAQVYSCGKVAFIVTDSTGRTIETSLLDSQQGAKGDTSVATDSLMVNLPTITIACGASGSVMASGSGTFYASIRASAGSPGFTVSPSFGALTTGGTTLTFSAGSGAITSPVLVDIATLALTQRVTVTVTGIDPMTGNCP